MYNKCLEYLLDYRPEKCYYNSETGALVVPIASHREGKKVYGIRELLILPNMTVKRECRC